MKKLWKIMLGLPVMLVLLVTGCSVEAPDSSTDLTAPTTPEVLASYASIGNSLTAGFMDAGLVINGQAGSYPALIAQQMGLSAAEFTQPLVRNPGIGSSDAPDGNAAGVIFFNGPGIAVLDSTRLTDIPTLLINGQQLTPYHNLGVPGATLTDITQAYNGASSEAASLDPDSPNSYFDFINRADSLYGSHEETVMLPNPAGGDDIPFTYQTASMFQQVVANGPSLLTVWVGNNDVLGPAMAGNPEGDYAPTPVPVFQAKYTALLTALAGGLMDRTGWPTTIVLANIPSISTIPYFIPVETFLFVTEWPLGFVEDNVEMVRFPALSWVKNPANQTGPLPDHFTLTTSEKGVIDGAVGAYNAVIAGVATAIDASGYAQCDYVDMNEELAAMTDTQKTHFMFLFSQIYAADPGAGLTAAATAAASMTYFSLDGIHPNNMGYGLVANVFIEKINDMMGTSIPLVDPAAFTWDPTYGVPLPSKTTLTEGQMPVIDKAAARAMDAVFR